MGTLDLGIVDSILLARCKSFNPLWEDFEDILDLVFIFSIKKENVGKMHKYLNQLDKLDTLMNKLLIIVRCCKNAFTNYSFCSNSPKGQYNLNSRTPLNLTVNNCSHVKMTIFSP